MNSRERGHPEMQPPLALCRAGITTPRSPGGMLQLLTFYGVAECHVNRFQFPGEYVLGVLDRVLSNEIWNRCIKLQQWCECFVVHLQWLVSLGNPCAILLCTHSASRPQMRTEQMSNPYFFLLDGVTQ